MGLHKRRWAQAYLGQSCAIRPPCLRVEKLARQTQKPHKPCRAHMPRPYDRPPTVHAGSGICNGWAALMNEDKKFCAHYRIKHIYKTVKQKHTGSDRTMWKLMQLSIANWYRVVRVCKPERSMYLTTLPLGANVQTHSFHPITVYSCLEHQWKSDNSGGSTSEVRGIKNDEFSCGKVATIDHRHDVPVSFGRSSVSRYEDTFLYLVAWTTAFQTYQRRAPEHSIASQISLRVPGFQFPRIQVELSQGIQSWWAPPDFGSSFGCFGSVYRHPSFAVLCLCSYRSLINSAGIISSGFIHGLPTQVH